ncbi:MAG: hypothetical protein Q8M00_03235 [bacterium]|nr:hypothetical protein [bacterium]
MSAKKSFLKFEKKHIPRRQLINLYEKRHLSIKETSSILDIAVSTIHRKLHRYGIEVRPIGKKRNDITLLKLHPLMEKNLTIKEIAQHFNCNWYTIKRKMDECSVRYRQKDNSITHYPKKNFSGNLLEAAYLIGFRLGDLTAKKEGNLIYVKMSTTKQEQIDLFKELFGKYTYIRIGKPDSLNAVRLNCYLNDSFDFLLVKKDCIPSWIYNNSKYMPAFAGGYIDAEGSFIINQKRGRFQMASYDRNILQKLYKWLVALKEISPRILLVAKKGQARSDLVEFKKDLWRLNVNEAFSLLRFIKIVTPYMRHLKRIRDMEEVRRNILFRKRQKTIQL